MFWLQDHGAVFDLNQNLLIGLNFKYLKCKEFLGLFQIISPLFHLHEISVIHLWQIKNSSVIKL